MKHEIYKPGDKNIPDAVKDRNGDVTLGLCKFCGKGEIELIEPCTQIAKLEDLTFQNSKLKEIFYVY